MPPSSPSAARYRSGLIGAQSWPNGCCAGSWRDSPTRCWPASRIDWRLCMSDRPDIVIVMTDEERAVPPYEAAEVLAWRDRTLLGRKGLDQHGVSFGRHYTGSLGLCP